MVHLALKVKNHAEILAMRDRLRDKGVPVMGPLEHGMYQSVYFAGPETLSLELSYSVEPIDNRAWIDPEVVELAGIGAQELERYKRPAGYEDHQGSVAQPELAATAGPHLTNYPDGAYEAVMAIPDDQIANIVTNEPPVKVEA